MMFALCGDNVWMMFYYQHPAPAPNTNIHKYPQNCNQHLERTQIGNNNCLRLFALHAQSHLHVYELIPPLIFVMFMFV